MDQQGDTEMLSARNFFQGIRDWFYPELCRMAWSTFRTLYEDQKLCDVTIKCNEKEYHAHRLILASASPYFYSLFLGPLCCYSTTSAAQVCTLSDFSSQSVKLLLDVLYMRTLDRCSSCNLVEVIRLADYLQIDQIVEMFVTLAAKRLSLDNCLLLLRESTKIGVESWTRQIRKFISSCFMKLVASEAFQTLSLLELGKLITSSELSCYPDRVRSYAISIWRSRTQCSISNSFFKRLLMKWLPGEFMGRDLSLRWTNVVLDGEARYATDNADDSRTGDEESSFERDLIEDLVVHPCEPAADVLVYTWDSMHSFPFKDLVLVNLRSGMVRFLNQGFSKCCLVPDLSYYDPENMHYFVWRSELYVVFTEASQSLAGNRLIIEKFDFIFEAWQEKFFDTLGKHLELSEPLRLTSCICLEGCLHLLFNQEGRPLSEFRVRMIIDLQSFSVVVVDVHSRSEQRKSYVVDSRKQLIILLEDRLPVRADHFFLVECDDDIYVFTVDRTDDVEEGLKVLKRISPSGWTEVASIEHPFYLTAVFASSRTCFLVYRTSPFDQTCRISEYKFDSKFDRDTYIECPGFSKDCSRFLAISGCLL